MIRKQNTLLDLRKHDMIRKQNTLLDLRKHDMIRKQNKHSKTKQNRTGIEEEHL